MNYFEIHLVEHCNLKCQYCDNYSSIAEKEFLSEESFENDFKRLSEICKNITKIRLLGGEPLLHPNLIFFLHTARKYFSDAEILLTTNGILLHTMLEEFWICCNKNNIVVEYTVYPIDIKLNECKELANRYNVKLITFGNYIVYNKTSHKITVNDKKDADITYNFKKCHRAGKCIVLKDGKIYPCTCIPNIYHFNKYFNKNLEVTNNDYIDIYTHNEQDIDDFLLKPVPFCGYCNINKIQQNIPWNKSKFELNDWFDNN